MEITEVMNSESTISSESGTEGASVESSATVSQEQDGSTGTSEGEANTSHENAGKDGQSENESDSGEPAPFLTVQFNHEDRALTQDEAVQFAQKGIKYDSMFTKVQRAAALRGQSVEAFCSNLEKQMDDEHLASLRLKYGDDQATIDELFEMYMSKKEKSVTEVIEQQLEAEKEEKDNLNKRLASEFIELKKEFPDIEKFDSLPKSVISAASRGKNLLSEFLLFKHAEQKAITCAEAKASAAKNASSGSMATDEAAGGAFDALMNGLWG